MKRSTRLLTMLRFLPTKAFLRLAYMNETGHILHLKNPRRFNEKLNALKLYDAAPTWSRYVDKLETREHVASVTTIDFFNMSGQKLAMQKMGYPTSELMRIKPSAICALAPVAKKLAAGFPYVRVDLYLHHNQVYFGEMTFFDSAALREFEPEPVNIMLGDMLTLPKPHKAAVRNETICEPSGGGILLERIHSGYAPRLSEN